MVVLVEQMWRQLLLLMLLSTAGVRMENLVQILGQFRGTTAQVRPAANVRGQRRGRMGQFAIPQRVGDWQFGQAPWPLPDPQSTTTTSCWWLAIELRRHAARLTQQRNRGVAAIPSQSLAQPTPRRLCDRVFVISCGGWGHVSGRTQGLFTGFVVVVVVVFYAMTIILYTHRE